MGCIASKETVHICTLEKTTQTSPDPSCRYSAQTKKLASRGEIPYPYYQKSINYANIMARAFVK